MMSYLEMYDLPPAVWDATYDKWKRAVLDGWSDRLWHKCAVCDLLNKLGDVRRCPLRRDRWCNGSGWSSRLSIHYHHSDDDAWKADVEKFLESLEPYMSENKLELIKDD